MSDEAQELLALVRQVREHAALFDGEAEPCRVALEVAREEARDILHQEAEGTQGLHGAEAIHFISIDTNGGS